MFGFAIATGLFSAFVFYKEILTHVQKACRRKRKKDIYEIHTNSIEGLWLAAKLANETTSKIHIVEYESTWQNPYFVGEDFWKTQKNIEDVLDGFEIEWVPSKQSIEAEVYDEIADENFNLNITNKKTFLHQLLSRFPDEKSVAILQWMIQLEKTNEDEFTPLNKADHDLPACLEELSTKTTRRFFVEQWEPMNGWVEIEDEIRKCLRKKENVSFETSHDVLIRTIDVRRIEEKQRGFVDWHEEIKGISPHLPYALAEHLIYEE